MGFHVTPNLLSRFYYLQQPLLALLIIFSLFHVASAEAAEKVVKSTEATEPETVDIAFFEYPPLAHLTHTGRISGFVVETVKEICREAGLNCHFRILPVARVYRSVFNGDASVIITGRHPSFDQCCVVSQWQYPWTAGIYSRSPGELIAETEEQLKYHRMIIIRGWRSPYRFFPNLETLSAQGIVKLSLAQDNISAIRMLQHERAEYMWGGDHFSWYLEKLGLTGQFNFKPLISSPLALWVDKNRPDIQLALDKGHQRLRKKGMLDKAGVQLNKSVMQSRYEEAAGY